MNKTIGIIFGLSVLFLVMLIGVYVFDNQVSAITNFCSDKNGIFKESFGEVNCTKWNLGEYDYQMGYSGCHNPNGCPHQ